MKINKPYLKVFLLTAVIFLSACSSDKKTTITISPKTASQIMLPSKDLIQSVMNDAYKKANTNNAGKNADYIPYLANVNSKLFGLTLVTAQGQIFTVGDANVPFAIESVSKVFQLALAMQQRGAEDVFNKLGVEPTGRAFNSVSAVEDLPGHIGNPLVNAGAMATTSLVKANSATEKWKLILDTLSDFAGENLTLNQEVYESEASSNQHNQAIALLLKSYGRLYDDPLETVDIYTKLCSISVTAKQLAIMGATLANHGINPITKKKLVNPEYVPKILAVMMMAGFYNEVGQWAWTAGVPAKTGVGGGIVAVVPGKYAIVGYAPKLDEAGNSIKASQAINYIVKKLGGNVFGN